MRPNDIFQHKRDDSRVRALNSQDFAVNIKGTLHRNDLRLHNTGKSLLKPNVRRRRDQQSPHHSLELRENLEDFLAFLRVFRQKLNEKPLFPWTFAANAGLQLQSAERANLVEIQCFELAFHREFLFVFVEEAVRFEKKLRKAGIREFQRDSEGIAVLQHELLAPLLFAWESAVVQRDISAGNLAFFREFAAGSRVEVDELQKPVVKGKADDHVEEQIIKENQGVFWRKWAFQR